MVGMNIIITEILESQRNFGEAVGLAKGLSMHVQDLTVKARISVALDKISSFNFSDGFWSELDKFNKWKASQDGKLQS